LRGNLGILFRYAFFEAAFADEDEAALRPFWLDGLHFAELGKV
jgi:hypothetical protein